MKVVINKCYGGFGVSTAALIKLIALDAKGVERHEAKEYYGGNNPNYAHRDWRAEYEKDLANSVDAGDGYRAHRSLPTLFKDDIVYGFDAMGSERADPKLVQVVEEMGEAANGYCAKLGIVEIPDGVEFEIDEYDGVESIHETHRSWS